MFFYYWLNSTLHVPAEWNPPTVADTKKKFYETFRRPVPAIYNAIIQELLVQQHIMRYNKDYSYDAVSRLAPGRTVPSTVQ